MAEERTGQPSAAEIFASNHMRLKQCRYGAMLYNINDLYIGRSLDLYGEFSEGEAALFRQLIKPGMVVCDIGANIGCHTVFMADAVGPKGLVIAFEPQRIVFQTLCANIALNGHANVRTFQAALGTEPGEIVIPPIRYDQEGNFGGVALGSYENGEKVPVMTLDALPFGSCHFVKIDVEGMERAVLEGGTETIKKFQPAMYIENDRRDQAPALIEHLFSLEYRLYWHHPPLFNTANFFGNDKNVFGNIISRNMLCLPKGSRLKIESMAEITDPSIKF